MRVGWRREARSLVLGEAEVFWRHGRRRTPAKKVQEDVRAGVGVAAMLDMRVEDDDG
jgi:hypothetical protein